MTASNVIELRTAIKPSPYHVGNPRALAYSEGLGEAVRYGRLLNPERPDNRGAYLAGFIRGLELADGAI